MQHFQKQESFESAGGWGERGRGREMKLRWKDLDKQSVAKHTHFLELEGTVMAQFYIVPLITVHLSFSALS